MIQRRTTNIPTGKAEKYGAWFLVYDDEAEDDTKAHYKYPYGKGGKIWRRAVIAIKQRASQNNFEALMETADRLLKAIDKKLGKDEEDKTGECPACQIERRYFPIQEMRVSKGDDGEMIIEGYPIVYEKYANLWGFKEIIRKGAAKKALEISDELVLWNHDSNQPMAAKKNGTLEAKEDKKGVFIRADVSGTVWGRDGYEAIASEVVNKMSFAFKLSRKGEDWVVEKIDGVEIDVREILQFEEIYDYSPVVYPAYEDTNVIARSKELALRNKPESEASDEEPSGAPLEVLKDEAQNRAMENKSLLQEVDYEENRH